MKISVLVCNYNHGKFIEESVGAILRQTHKDIEVIVMDDASTDDSVTTIYGLMDMDSRIRLHRHRNNLGLLKTFEEGLKLCTGDLFMGCGADDVLVSQRFFERCNAMLGAKPEACGVFGISRRIDAVKGITLSELGIAPNDGFVSPEDFLKGFFERTCFVPGFSVMWRRSMLDDVGGFAMDLGPQFDYWVNHALPSLHGIFYIPEVVSLVRIFEDGSNFSAAHPNETEIRLQRHAKFEKRIRKLTGFSDVIAWRKQLIYDLCDGKDLEANAEIYMKELLC